jgi:hypothetical protein
MTSDKPYTHIDLTLEDGREYRIEAHKIAHYRANHYGKSSEFPSFQEGYKEEYDYTICNSDELGEWLMNNMDWYELEPVLIRHELPDLSDARVVAKNYHQAR